MCIFWAQRVINKLIVLQVKKAKAEPDKNYSLSDGGNFTYLLILLEVNV